MDAKRSAEVMGMYLREVLGKRRFELIPDFVAQEMLQSSGRDLYCWANNTSEVEFMIEFDGKVLPVEVKSGSSGKLKSLNTFAQKYAPSYRTRISAKNLEINHEAAMHSYPLYLSARFPLQT